MAKPLSACDQYKSVIRMIDVDGNQRKVKARQRMEITSYKTFHKRDFSLRSLTWNLFWGCPKKAKYLAGKAHTKVASSCSLTCLRSISLQAKNNDNITMMDTKCNILVKLLVL